MPDAPRQFRVLVALPPVVEAASEITRFEWIEVSKAQYDAYANGDANWRAAKAAAPSWFGRTWRRLSGRDA